MTQQSSSKCRAGLAWDYLNKKIDLDMSVIAFDKIGKKIDVAYFNNPKPKIFDGNIIHSGDNRDGRKDGDDEYIDINLDKLDRKVKSLFFLANIYEGGTFQDVKTAKFTLYRDEKLVEAHTFGSFDSTAYLIGALFRHEKLWQFRWFKHEYTGKNFKESMSGVVQNLKNMPIYDEDILTDEPNDPNKTYNLKKDEIYTFKKDISEVTLALGWDPSDTSDEIDVDAGVILLSQKKENIGIVSFENPKYKDQIIHTGDNLTGRGKGDDEQIKLFLNKIDDNISYIAVGICIFTKNVTFNKIKNCFVRLIKKNGFELCNFNLSNGNYGTDAMIMGYLHRNKKGLWAFKSCGDPTTGRVLKQLVEPVKNVIS